MMQEVPTHLSCPFCPAQSYPVKVVRTGDALLDITDDLASFECPSKHKFLIEVQQK